MEDQFLKVAKQAALEAGKIISKYFGKEHTYSFKNEDKSDYATQADLESEKKIIEILRKSFPDHNIIAEESKKIDNGSSFTWVIDPLDGTISFAHDFPFFAVSIGLLKDHQPILGVIYHVVSNDLYEAKIREGAYLNGQKIHVSKNPDLNSAVIGMDIGHRKKRGPKIDLYILPVTKEAGYIQTIGSTAMCMALTAKGGQDGMVAQAFPWDFAAGTVIVREAGGKVTDLKGQEPDFKQDRLNILATNGLVHDEMLEVLK